VIHAVIDWALRNRLLVLLVTVVVCVLGVLAYQRMPKDIYPDLNAPLVNIITSCPGMAAEDVERLITFPLESLMNGTPHVLRVRSESTTGESVVTVEFDWGVDVYLARQIVAGKLEILAEQLPAGASRPVMGPVSSRMGEIFEFAVVGDGVDPMELRSVADWTIRYRLLGVEGVSFVVNLGGFVRQYQVFLKPDMLHHHKLTIGQVKEAIEKSNRNFSGGIITKKTQEFLIKGVGRIDSIAHIENTVIACPKGVPVFVKDVAEVKEGPKFARGDAGFNGQDAVSVVVQKQYGGDTLKTIENIKRFLADIRRHIPPNVDIAAYYDQSQLISSTLQHVGTSMLEGGALVFLVILLFLWNLRAALIASLTIPISVLLSLLVMDLCGVSLTVMALGGLAIGIGKMAGGSVIMVENICRQAPAAGKEASALERAASGAKEIGGYLFSANLIIILAFLPLLTLEGIAGRMFRPTAFAVVVALFGALVINITLQPALMSFGGRARGRPARDNLLVASATRAYAAALRFALRRKGIVLAVAIAILAAGAWCYPQLGSEFVPFLDEGSIIASTVMLPETSLAESVRIGKKVEAIFKAFPEVLSVCRTTGAAEESEHVHPVNHSHYLIQLKPREERQRGYSEITEAMRAELDKLPGIVYMFEQPIANKMSEMLTGTEGQLSLKVFGPDLNVLNEKVEEIQQVLSRLPGVADLQVEQTAGIPMVAVRLDRQALARHGLRVAEVADLVETALNGVEVTDVWEAEKTTSVLVRLPAECREGVEAIERLLVDTPAGHRVPLSQIAHIDRSEGPQTVFREGLMRRKVILSNVVGRDVGSFVQEARDEIARHVSFPPGYHFTFGGQFESQQRTARQLAWMMLVVGLSVLVVLFASLGSLGQSLVLLLNVPMTVAGGLVALYLTGQTLNVSSLIGFIALFGIAIQNGVVLVGKINDLRTKGKRVHDAVLEGSIGRFRPILMTELILILGVLPLAFGTASGAEIHRPLALVYIGGFIAAIFFEQVALPVLYELFAKEGLAAADRGTS
jgi:cobalt-zinc-cadmium resistance protein CzcA